jgi:predicted MFS family arabinose efflux permease
MIIKNSSEKLFILTLALIQFIHILDFMVMMPLGPHFIRDFSIDAGQFSFLISAYTFSAGFVGFLGSFFLDKFERKKIVLVLLCGFILGTLFCALSPTFYLLLVSRIVTGAFGGVLSAAVLALIGDSIPEQRRGQAMGVVMSAFSVASVIGVPSGLYMANLFSWKAPFYLIVITGVFVFILALKAIPVSKFVLRETDSTDNALLQTLKSKNQLFALATSTCKMLGQFAVVPLISAYMVSNVGVAEQSLPYIYIFGGIAAMLMSIFSGKLSDKFGSLPIFVGFTLLSLVPVLTITHMGFHSTLLFPLCFTTLFFISSSGRMVSGTTLVLSSVGAKQRGGFMSMNSCVQQISAGIAAFIGGAIVYQLPSGKLENYSYVGYWAVGFALLSIVVASRVKSVDSSD